MIIAIVTIMDYYRLFSLDSNIQLLHRRLTWRVLWFIIVYLSPFGGAQIRYSIPEEMRKGALIGNIAHDLGIDVKRLLSGRARIVTGDGIQHTELKTDKGILVVNERIDREQLCGETTPCSFSFEIILDNPMELHQVTVEILDVNDHSPTFQKREINLEISESAVPGVRFLLGSAEDHDVGTNALQNYILTNNNNFALKQHTRLDGLKYAEMVLQNPLDRELQPRISLILTAVDGGNPQRSGSVNIDVTVLDANDNAPVFNQSVYRVSVMENAPKGTYITTVNASDADSGSNGFITYSFANLKGNVAEMFQIDQHNGMISLNGDIDYEKTNKFDIGIEAKDQGGLGDSSKVIIEVIDVNDNVPTVSVMSFSSPVSEDSPPGTTIAILNAKDLDAAENGQVSCSIDQNIPFTIKSSLRNYYTVVTGGKLDRELISEYNITITATDSGSPPLSSTITLHLKVSDVNDNSPVFAAHAYTAHVPENNSPSTSIFTVCAHDTDSNQNARISYLLEDTIVAGSPVSTYISVNTETGVIYAVRSFDYEQIKHIQVSVKAQDGGSPPLSSNVTLNILIDDQNDNAPQVLYPVQTGGSLVAEMVPRSADVGYLVTKVVAVDVDSGQNAWLSYKLQKATDRALFEVGLQNGEIRTVRQVTDKDAVKQKLTVVVEDNGQPSRSTTVNVNAAVADSFPEVLSEYSDFTHEKDYNDNLTFYLVLALAVVSFLFISCVVVIISVKIYRWRQYRNFKHTNLPVIPYYPPRYADGGGTGTLQHVYNYEVCMTTDSRKSDCTLSRPFSQNVLIMDPSSTMTRDHASVQNSQNKIFLGDAESHEQQKPPNNDWRFNQQGQRPGPSGQYTLVPHYSTHRSSHTGHTDRLNTGTYRHAGGTQSRWTPYDKARAGPHPEGAGGVIAGTGPWPNPPTEAEQLQALMAAANEVSEATATLGPRYNAQFPMQHVPDYRQNVYIPGSTATLTANPQQVMPQQALQGPPQARPQADVPKAAQTPASKKKSTKKDKK
uniref:Cadherin domain-containing protein n=1 Tax=Esox lucius TaxID=8010 RepID=A0A3P8Y9W4_ESOLU